MRTDYAVCTIQVIDIVLCEAVSRYYDCGLTFEHDFLPYSTLGGEGKSQPTQNTPSGQLTAEVHGRYLTALESSSHNIVQCIPQHVGKLFLSQTIPFLTAPL